MIIMYSSFNEKKFINYIQLNNVHLLYYFCLRLDYSLKFMKFDKLFRALKK